MLSGGDGLPWNGREKGRMLILQQHSQLVWHLPPKLLLVTAAIACRSSRAPLFQGHWIPGRNWSENGYVPRKSSFEKKIVARHCEGILAAQIVIEENIPERTIRRVYQQWKKNGTAETKSRSGRPPLFNDRKRRELGRVVRANSCVTLEEISQLISTKASEKTIRRELRKLE
ncbi:unnamed protein product [Rhizopus microsporus]